MKKKTQEKERQSEQKQEWESIPEDCESCVKDQ
jgi:hypothetical protein